MKPLGQDDNRVVGDTSIKRIARLSTLIAVTVLILVALLGPAEARFLSPDTWDPWLQGVDTNRYSYSGNDPINQSDPDGHQVFPGDDDHEFAIPDLDEGGDGNNDGTINIAPFSHDVGGIEVYDLGICCPGVGKAATKSTAKKVSSRGGKLGDSLTKQRTVEVKAEIAQRGNIARTEIGFKIKNGFKLTRYVDVAEYSPDGRLISLHQIGILTKGGLPVMRERKAISDLAKRKVQGSDAREATINFHDKFKSGNDDKELNQNTDTPVPSSCNWNGC